MRSSGSAVLKKILFLAIILVFISSSIHIRSAEETLCYTQKIVNASSFNIYTGWDDNNNPILWDHSVPPGVLGTVVRVGLYIEAWDVDYPANDEHDRVYFNGYDLGLLEGINDTWITVEKTIPVSSIKEGLNELRIAVDELKKGWKVTIRSSELRFYCSTPDPDFTIGATPSSVEIESGGTALYKVVLTPLNGFSSPVDLRVSGLPAGATGSFGVDPVTPGGETELTVSTTIDVEPGVYKLKITGTGDNISKETEVELIISDSPCPEFEVDFTANPDHGSAPLEVVLKSIIKRGSKHSGDYVILWDLGDGNTSTRESLTHVYGTEGKYRVNLKITDKCGTIREIEKVIHVNSIRIDCKKSVNRSEAKPGEEIEYKIALLNLSSKSLESFTLRDVLSTDLEFISQESVFEFIQNGRELRWSGKLLPSETEWIEIKVRIRWGVFNGTRIENHAVLNDPFITEEIESNSVYTTVSSEPVSISKVRFTKKSETPASRIGQVARFRLSIENHSDGTLLNLNIEDMLPQGFAYITGSTILDGLKWSDPSGTRRLTWNIPSLPSGQTTTIRFQTVISSDVRRGRNTNRAFLIANDNTGQTIRLEDSDIINVSSDGMIFYSGLQGTVYIDKDRDELFSSADTPLEGIEIRISTGERAVTDHTGAYSFLNLLPGDYAVGVNKVTLPEKYKLSYPYSIPVYLNDGLTDTIDFALRFSKEDPIATSRLEGRVFFDRNGDLVFNSGDVPAESFRAVIDDRSSTVGRNGKFVFSHLVPGKHTIEIFYGQKSIKREVKIPPGKQQSEFPLKYTGIKVIVTGEK